MVGKKAFIPCERKLSDDVLRYFHGCIESIQSLWRKLHDTFSMLGKKAFDSFMRKLIWCFECFHGWKEIIQPSNLNGQATGYCWGTNLRAIISCIDPKFHSCFLNWKLTKYPSFGYPSVNVPSRRALTLTP
jgi:hypothetical protein